MYNKIETQNTNFVCAVKYLMCNIFDAEYILKAFNTPQTLENTKPILVTMDINTL
jgi:hypothetical protein